MPAKGTYGFSFHAFLATPAFISNQHEMKNSISVLLIFFFSFPSFCQPFIFHFQVKDSLSGLSLDGVQAQVVTSDKVKWLESNEMGHFHLVEKAGKPDKILVYKAFFKPFEISGESLLQRGLVVLLAPKTKVSQEILVKPLQANDLQPISQSRISENAIRQRYFGADVPSLINQTPSINMYSDAGNGIGYSFFRIRGIDQTRINFTVNGIPVNDPENQGFFFNNFADLASSAQSIQIQRGVGLSANGTASLGGSINIVTKDLTEDPAFEFSTGLGSFSSNRIMARFQTGRLAKNWAFGGRFSQIKSAGYRQNSESEIQSYNFSAGYFGEKTIFKFHAFGGFSQSRLAYLGIDKATLDSQRTQNPFVNGEKDAFRQHFQHLQVLHRFNENWSGQASAYLVLGNAPRFQFLFPALWGYSFQWFNMPNLDSLALPAGDIMTSYRLDQQLIGGFGHLEYKTQKFQGTLGFHANHFVSDHFMEINWGRNLPEGIQQNHLVYFNTGRKSEFSAYLRGNYQIAADLNWFSEIQFRRAGFSYDERKMQVRPSFGSMEPMSWNFINPKTGIRWAFHPNWAAYGVLGLTSREPTRFDYFQDDFATREKIKQNELKHETVVDAELGFKFSNGKNTWININAFYLDFRNQIVGTGQLNTFGTPINTNVESSYRSGLEWEGSLRLWGNSLILHHASSWMTSQIRQLNQRYFFSDFSGDTSLTFKNVKAVLSPEWIVNQAIEYMPISWLNLGLSGRFTSMQYLDNTQSAGISLPEFWFLDFRTTLDLSNLTNFGNLQVSFFLNNISNQKYATAGSVAGFSNLFDRTSRQASATPLFFPAATRNWFLSLNWRF
jgi:iron complex outermembrane receptor protein